MADDTSTTTTKDNSQHQVESEEISKKAINLPIKKILGRFIVLVKVLFFPAVFALKFFKGFVGGKKLYRHKKIIVFALLIILAGGFFFVRTKGDNSNPSAQVSGAISSQVPVNRKFEIQIKTKDGKETGEKLLITVTSIEKTDNILIQNKPAKTKAGKTFLIINLEIQNDTKKQLKVKPVDMVRLIGNDGRNYAPDVHNNEVSSEPISLKRTKVGYVVDEVQKNFKLLIGEVRGTQETIEIEI